MTNRILPQVINVLIIVQRSTEAESNVKHGNYRVTCIPEKISVENSSALLVYQIIDPTPSGISLVGFFDSEPFPLPPTEKQQLSQPPTVSVDGKMLAIFDANTSREVIQVHLVFVDTANGKLQFFFDPQVGNDGRA